MPAGSATSHPSTAGQLAMLRRRWFSPLFAILFLLQLAQLLLLCAGSIPIRMDLTYPEGSVVQGAAAVAGAEPLYTDWRAWPHHFTPYGPLTYYPVGLLSKLVNRSGDIFPIYIIGRLQSFAALLGIGMLLFRFIRRLGSSRIAALASIGALTCWLTLINYGLSYRPDAPATLFAFLALSIVIRYKPKLPALAAAFAALYLSFWFKPTAFGILLVVALWVWRGLGPLKTLIWLFGFAIAGLLPAYALDRHWNGLFFLNLVGFNAGAGFSLTYLKVYFGAPSLTSLVMLAGTVFAVRGLADSDLDARFWLSLAALGTLFFTFLQCLKLGADMNYFLLPYPLLNLLAFQGIEKIWRESKSPAAEVFMWVAVIPLVAFSQIGLLSGIRAEYKAITKNWTAREIESATGAAPGLMLSSVPYFSIIQPRPPTILDPYAYSIMVRRGQIDPAPLLERVGNKSFSVILLYHESATEDADVPNVRPIIGEALSAHYQRAYVFPAMVAYRPKP